MALAGRRPGRDRRDGRLVTDLPALRRVVPHLMPTRVEATVYYRQHLEVEPALAWLERANADRGPGERYTFFHVFLTAYARLFRRRPELNRFVIGRRTYEHRDITFSFTVKRALNDEASEGQVHLTFGGTETVAQVREAVDGAVRAARVSAPDDGDRLVETLVRLPRPVLAGVARTVWALDTVDLVPRALREAIPVYTSSYVVNLGSLQADAPFHHLYQRGTASIFASVGRIRPEPVVDGSGAVVARHRAEVVWTVDERATDGFYLVRSSRILQEMLDDPDGLARPEGVTADGADGAALR